MEKKIAILIIVLVIIILINVALLVIFMPELNGTYAKLQRTGEVSFDVVLSENADFKDQLLNISKQYADIYTDNGLINPFLSNAEMKLIQFDAVTDTNQSVKKLDMVVQFESNGAYYAQTLKISDGSCNIKLRKADGMPQNAPAYKDFIQKISAIDYSEYTAVSGEWALSYQGFEQLADSKQYAAETVVLGENGKPFPSGTPVSIYHDYTVVTFEHDDEVVTSVVKYRFYIN